MSENSIDLDQPIEQECDCEACEEMLARIAAAKKASERNRGNEDVDRTSHSVCPLYAMMENWKQCINRDMKEQTRWMKESHDYRARVTHMIQANHGASELLRYMKHGRKTIHRGDFACYRTWWLTAATEHNHIELVTLMLADTQLFESTSAEEHYASSEEDLYDLDSKRSVSAQAGTSREEGLFVQDFRRRKEMLRHYGRAFYKAIEKGHISLVRKFLVAGASGPYPYVHASRYVYNSPPSDDKLRVRELSKREDIYKDVSALEYACIVNQPEVVKVLVSFFNNLHPPRTRQAGMHRENILRPLHMVMVLATQFYGPHLAWLPNYVQMIIKGGEDVDCINEDGYTPLQLLIQNVRTITPLDESGAKYRRTIIDIAKVLLDAGSRLNTVTTDDRHPLTLLVGLIDRWNHFGDMYEAERTKLVSAFRVLRHHLQLVNDLARFLLLRGADARRNDFYELIPLAAARILDDSRLRCTRVCDELLNSLSSLFRLALFAEANSLTDDYWIQFISSSTFVDSLITIADCSSRPGRSEQLIYTLLEPFSANILKKLTEKLHNKRIASASQPSWKRLYAKYNEAIRYVNIVSGPRSLQDLSRRAITRDMSVEGLLSDTSVDLGLPPKLEAFVLLRERTKNTN